MPLTKLSKKDIENLRSINGYGIWCFISREKKKVYLAEGNMLKGLVKVLELIELGELNELAADLNDLEFEVLEWDHHKDRRKLRMGYYLEQFKDYHKYRNYRPIKLTSRVSCREFFNSITGSLNYYFTVELVNRKWQYDVVGVFEKEQEAREFMDKEYPEDQGIYRKRISTSKLTSGYIFGELKLRIE